MYITYFIIFHKLIIFITKNNISRIKFKKLELKNRCVKNCTLIIKQLNSIRGVNFLEFRANFGIDSCYIKLPLCAFSYFLWWKDYIMCSVRKDYEYECMNTDLFRVMKLVLNLFLHKDETERYS